jgi:hypothetical protein
LLTFPLFSARKIENRLTPDVLRTCVPPHACASKLSISTTAPARRPPAAC